MTKAKAKTPHYTDNLRKAHAAKAVQGKKSHDTVLAALQDSDQPLTATEVHAKLAARGMHFDDSYVRLMLRNLVKQNAVSTRLETPQERKIRVNSGDMRGAHLEAHYYWAPAGKVPRRTTPTDLPFGQTTRRKRKYKTAAKKTTTTAKRDDVTARVEALSSELSLLKRIAELENQLASVRKALN